MKDALPALEVVSEDVTRAGQYEFKMQTWWGRVSMCDAPAVRLHLLFLVLKIKSSCGLVLESVVS